MSVVLQVLGVPGLVIDDADGHVGDYIVSCDVDAFDGRGDVVTSPDVTRALVFPDNGSALAYWHRQSTVRPLRPDGKPNRPLTAFTVQTVPR